MPMKKLLSIKTLLLCTVAAILIASCGGGERSETKRTISASTSFSLDHNRMIVEVELGRPDGSRRTAYAWVDTGNQFLVVAEELARDLGLDTSALDQSDALRPVESSSPAPEISLGGFPLTRDGVSVQISRGSRVWAGVPAEANLPASLLRELHVVFDYPQQRLTVAEAGQMQTVGVEVPCRIHPETGLVQVTASVEGEKVELGVDTGSVGTWVSDNLTRALAERHPDRRRSTGAVGPANFFGFEFEPYGTLMRLPEIRIGDVRAAGVAVLGLDQRLFDWYSAKSAAPVVGIVGANVLRGFRLEVDFLKQMSYWQPGPPMKSTDLDIVGLTLRPEANGSFTVAGVAKQNGNPAVQGVEAGDTLRRIDALQTDGETMGTVIDALRGKPGDSRLLVIERGGERLEIEAVVTRFP
jgi:predicted aspartyl protease